MPPTSLPASSKQGEPKARQWSREEIDQHLRAESIIDPANCSVALEVAFTKISPAKAIIIYQSKFTDQQKVELAKVAQQLTEQELAELTDNLQSEVTLSLESATINTILSIGIHSPMLAMRLAQIANDAELRRETVEWVCHIATFDLNLLDARGPNFKRRNELPANLAFRPALHLKYSDIQKYVSSKKMVLDNPQKGSNNFYFDDKNMMIHTRLNHTELLEAGLGGVLANLLSETNNIKQLDNVGKNYGVQQSSRYAFEFFYGDPDWMEQRQRVRLDLLVKCHQDFAEFDYRPFDRSVNTNELADLIDHQPMDKLLIILFQKFQGIVISESHREPNAKQFLCAHMSKLAELNIDTIYIEHIPHYMQKYLDEYLYSNDADQMLPILEKFLKRVDDHNGALQIYPNGNLFDLVTQAKRVKIRIVGMDDNVRSRATASNREENGSLRDMTVNQLGKTKIQHNQLRDKKFVILSGRAHCQTHRGLTNGVPGFSQLFGIPSIQIGEDGSVAIVHEDKGKRCGFSPPSSSLRG